MAQKNRPATKESSVFSFHRGIAEEPLPQSRPDSSSDNHDQ
jgi:hypothetical protein